jgi:hypothetical protein
MPRGDCVTQIPTAFRTAPSGPLDSHCITVSSFLPQSF